ncbi:MAG: hypothetical protein D3906_14380, partial [Candidatus Electrothrix sp. AUS1_2]|nr:hypothetical protein [Candidatus Electrothrix sp. AUS1_2]
TDFKKRDNQVEEIPEHKHGENKNKVWVHKSFSVRPMFQLIFQCDIPGGIRCGPRPFPFPVLPV